MNLTGMWEMEITIVVPKLQSYVACGKRVVAAGWLAAIVYGHGKRSLAPSPNHIHTHTDQDISICGG
ncbi:hypothetical protein VNO80_28706 [Phaseolus coccineus]|uniref:Uncharacterized protein n=1 Tax=Phaseolus coccineus TaxID=3886 RepID=A0AAN9LAX2_PHACN